MKRKKIDSFTLFVILLLSLILTLLGVLLAGMKEEKRQFTVLLPLGNLAYDEDFLQKAKKIKGIKEIWPVIEVPVVIKIEDYTETTTFSGIDMNRNKKIGFTVVGDLAPFIQLYRHVFRTGIHHPNIRIAFRDHLSKF